MNGQKLPDGFQRAEFLMEHGFVDRIVTRDQLKNTLGSLLKLHRRDESQVVGTALHTVATENRSNNP